MDEKKKRSKNRFRKNLVILTVTTPIFLGLVLILFGSPLKQQLQKVLSGDSDQAVETYILKSRKKNIQEKEESVQEESRVLLSVNYISQLQEGYPTGCESACAVMALQYEGISIDMKEFVTKDLNYEPVREEAVVDEKISGTAVDGKNHLMGPDPNQAFAGNPSQADGYGCFLPVIKTAVEHVFERRKISGEAVDYSGKKLDEFVENTIGQGKPVIIWVTNGFVKYKDGTRWFIRGENRKFTWTKGEHCILIVGYDDEQYYYHDPLNGEVLGKEKDAVETSYEWMGMQAMSLVNIGLSDSSKGEVE